MQLSEDPMEKPILRKTYLWSALACCVIGGALALYATHLTLLLARHVAGAASGCSLNAWISCEAALSSKFSMLFEIPVAWLGFLFYLWAALILTFALFRKDQEEATASTSAVLIGAMAAVLLSVFKAVQLVILKVLCPVCVGMYLVNLAMVLLIMPALGLSYREFGIFLREYSKSLLGLSSKLTFDPKPFVYCITAAWIFGLGYFGIREYEKDVLGLHAQEKAFNMDEALKKHFAQKPVEVPVDSAAAVKGDANAAITMVEFADFECPACKELADYMHTILPEYPGKVRLYFMNYPLDSSINRHIKHKIHTQSGLAACAGVCAQEYGDFWAYHDELFKNQKKIDREFLLNLAEKQGWDREKFNARMNDPDVLRRVKDDIEAGEAVGLTGTPDLFINGRHIKYWDRPKFIKAVIARELEQQRPDDKNP